MGDRQFLSLCIGGGRVLNLKSLTCLVIRHHTCLEMNLCLTRFSHASTLLACYATRFLHAMLHFLHATIHFLHNTLRFLPITLRFLHATLRFLHATIHFLHASLRFLHATIRFLHATLRFSHATLLARFFGVVIRVGVCIYRKWKQTFDNTMCMLPWKHDSMSYMASSLQR
jgi:hypothetical protein